MTRILIPLLTTCALLFYNSTIYASNEQHPQQQTTESKIEKTDSTVNATKKILEKLPKISGYVNAQYSYSDNGTNTFQIRRARIDLKGDLGKRLDYRFQFDLASKPKLLDAYMRLKIVPYFNIQFGQFKLPFTLESTMGPLTWETIDIAQSVSKLSGYSDVSGEGENGRDIGLSFYGGLFKQNGFNLIDYSLGFVNGSGINTSDNNSQKNFFGRLEIHPIKAITLSGSLYLGTMNGIKDPSERMPKNRFAISARYDDKRYLVRAEYLRGKCDTGAAGLTTSDGYYILVGYNIKGKVMPVLRYDTFRKDVSAANGRSTYYVAGINYQPWKYLRLQLTYTLKDLQSASKKVNQIAGMATFIF